MTSRQKGGAFIDASDLADLAVPFGILLAQRGLSSYLKGRKEPKKQKGGSNNSKASVSATASCALCNRMNGGAGCGAPLPPPRGGSNSQAIVQKELHRLSVELRNLLDNSSM